MFYLNFCFGCSFPQPHHDLVLCFSYCFIDWRWGQRNSCKAGSIHNGCFCIQVRDHILPKNLWQAWGNKKQDKDLNFDHLNTWIGYIVRFVDWIYALCAYGRVFCTTALGCLNLLCISARIFFLTENTCYWITDRLACYIYTSEKYLLSWSDILFGFSVESLWPNSWELLSCVLQNLKFLWYVLLDSHLAQTFLLHCTLEYTFLIPICL